MSLKQIFKQISAKISDVGVAIDRRPARVHLHLAARWIEWPKFFERARVSIEEADRHYSISTVATAIAAIPSPRPIAPSPSFVVALMLTRAASSLSADAIFSRMAGICGAIFGASAINVASTFNGR